jgi:hypothetical protein
MHLFILGMLLGSGLVLAFQELRRQHDAFQQRRWIRRSNEAIALLAPETHGYCRSWCHDSQAEHDADVQWTDDQIKAATDAEIYARIEELADQAERVWPGTKDTAW